MLGYQRVPAKNGSLPLNLKQKNGTVRTLT